MPNVDISFGATIGPLISGISEVKAELASISEPVNAVAGALTDLGGAVAGAFAVDQVAQFVSQMEDLGTKTLRTAAELGVSTTEAQELGFIAKATGGSADSLALSMERLQLNLQKAQSGTGPAAEALQALGLSAKSLIGLPLDEQMNRIADAMARFADGGNKTAIAMALLGRSGAEMIPVLDKGRAGLDALRQSAADAGAIVSQQTIIALDQAGTAAVALRASMTALGEAIVGAFAKSLIEATNELTTFIGDLSALVQTGHLGEAAMEALGAAVREAAANFASLAIVAADVLSLEWNKVAADWKAGNDEIKRIQAESDTQLITMATSAKAELQKILTTPETSNKPQAPALPVPNTAAINAAMSAAQEQIKLADEVYQQVSEKLGSEVKLHQITYSQETAALLAALDKRRSAELAAVAQEASVGGLSVAQEQKIANEKLQIDQKYAQARQKIMDQAQQKEINDWKNAIQPIESAFDSQISGLLAGTETFAQATKKVFADMVTDIIKELVDLAIEEAIVFAVTGSFGSVGSVGTGIIGGIGKLAGFDVGTDYVLQSGLAIIHQGESVVPAAQGSGPYSGGGQGNGMVFAPNFSGFIGTQAMINQIVPQLARSLQSYQNLNPSTA